jgi:soluble lytic murein transglycosylase-like protein
VARRTVIRLAVIAAVAIALAIYVSRQRVSRHPAAFRRPHAKATAPKDIPPVEQWTAMFERISPSDLDDLLERIEKQRPDLYSRYSLAYLHARARLEKNDLNAAAQKLAPYLAKGNPLRDLALYHQSEIDDARKDEAAASRDRQTLIFEYPAALYRDEAIDDETEHLSRSNVAALVAFASRLMPTAPASRKRDLEAHIVEAEMRSNANDALARALRILHGGTMDDAADRASRAIDQPQLIARLRAEQVATLGDAMQNHRHFDRAVALLSLALRGLPQKHDDILFAIGRSQFGAEKFADAQQTYLRGATETKSLPQKATFFWHAARAAQLRGDDRTAEQLMSQAIAVPVRSPSAIAALQQRMRTRLMQHRVAEANADLAQIRKAAPNEHALVEASLAYAIAMIGGGNNGAAVVTLNSIPPKLLDKFDRPEIAYWRARALESRDRNASFAAYLECLRATVPSHFAYFARNRLDAQALANELASRDAEVEKLIAAKNWVAAKQAATDRILLSARDRTRALQRLTLIYQQLPAYRAILELKPQPFPALPNAGNDRASLLMALGLFDEVATDVPKRWPLHPLSSGLTQSLALNRGAASKQSIFAVEVLMNSVPADYVPDLLPQSVRQLLYPRYFYDAISQDAKKFDADPMLVLSIMREESRFNPRAKSEAAARGLLQFIITTAVQIGRDIGLVNVTADDLYDPRVIIRLGAKYVGELQNKFGDDHYKTAAAYNAGPNQTALWARTAPAPGDDFFLSCVTFDETKNYVRKVMNSYKRYSEIYGNAGPQGGLRAEP